MIYKAKRALTAAEQRVERRGGQLVWMKDGVTLHCILKREGKYGPTYVAVPGGKNRAGTTLWKLTIKK